jgi:Domain of unknown function (DUF3598)
MNSNWENFLQNLGEWHGSFTTFSAAGEILSNTESGSNLKRDTYPTVSRY